MNFYKEISLYKPKRLDQSKKNIFVLYDQLSNIHPLITDPKKEILLFIESSKKPTLRNYHKQKLVFILSSMRHFALEKAKLGFEIIYHYSENFYDTALDEVRKQYALCEIGLLEPAEYETSSSLKHLDFLKIESNTLFLSTKEEFEILFQNKKNYLLETFYRFMRVKYSILMEGKKPIGGIWNFDKENREPFKFKDEVKNSSWIKKQDSVTLEVINLVNTKYKNHFGNLENFEWAVTRNEALHWLNNFIEFQLPNFGKYEDAMSIKHPYLFHSLISPYLNNGLLHPMECIEAAIQSYERGNSELNSVEGFIRQILGWREYMRHVFNQNPKDYASQNFFNHKNPLPKFYWEANSKMKCVDETISSVIKNSHSHHITRLMILSNLANLLNINPKELNDWFYEMYIDAFDWVVTPNVIGMGLYADGGIISTKPYIASANYIQKMGSEFCKNCIYDSKKILEEDGCPFNSLYWNFIIEKKSFYKKLPRDYSIIHLNKMSLEKIESIQKKAKSIREEIYG